MVVFRKPVVASIRTFEPYVTDNVVRYITVVDRENVNVIDIL